MALAILSLITALCCHLSYDFLHNSSPFYRECFYAILPFFFVRDGSWRRRDCLVRRVRAATLIVTVHLPRNRLPVAPEQYRSSVLMGHPSILQINYLNANRPGCL